jgi:hypothetical protein
MKKNINYNKTFDATDIAEKEQMHGWERGYQ